VTVAVDVVSETVPAGAVTVTVPLCVVANESWYVTFVAFANVNVKFSPVFSTGDATEPSFATT
jgi:hypothetical protein